MTTKRKIGIWMDNSSAHLMEFTSEAIETKTIESKFSHEAKVHSLSKSEDLMHNKEQHLQSDYFKKLAEVIKKYDEVLLFGPTNAKSELHNILKDDHLFEKIKIEVKSSDKLTENQQHAFVKDHFSNG